MKTNYLILLCLLFLSLFSCSKKDDDSFNQMTVKIDPIIGEWTFADDNMVTDIEGLDFQYSIDYWFFTFNPDGTGVQGFTITIEGNEPEKIEDNFNWENENTSTDFTEKSQKYVFETKVYSESGTSPKLAVSFKENVSAVFSVDFNSVELIFSNSEDS